MTLGVMNIKRASVDDAERVLQFLRDFRAEGLETVLRHETLPSLDDEQAFIRKLDGEAGVMFVADVDGEIAGCLTAEVHRHSQLKHSCEFGICVLAKYRSRNFGSQLIEQLVAWARSKGLRRVELGVFRNNQRAISLYRKFGFVEEGRKEGAIRIGSKYEDSIQMVLQL
jgi:ribosomal protein S18 acetylase RimI-like enzyme